MAQSSILTPTSGPGPRRIWGQQGHGEETRQGGGDGAQVGKGHWQYLPADFIDIVKDPVPPNEYRTEEDPKLFHSIKTQRGPLSENWIEEYRQQVFPIMCAYKLCKVEFRYWGMQSKIERFIHDTGEHAGVPARRPLCLGPGVAPGLQEQRALFRCQQSHTTAAVLHTCHTSHSDP